MKRCLYLLCTLWMLVAMWPRSGVAAAPALKSYSADHFDVMIEVQPGGDLLVTETLVLRFVGGPFSYAFRHIPTDMTDGVEIVNATL